MTNLRVTVGILSWNRKDALRIALQSVRKQSIFPEAEVLVVDNCSKDRTREMVREEFPWVRLFEREENSGLAEGRNILVRLAKAPIVFWMDDDCELVEEDCLERLVLEMETHPKYSVIFARILEGDNGPPHMWVPADVAREPLEFRQLYPQTFASGGTCVRTRQFLDIGGYDSDFFRMGVENAFAYRVFQAGGVICYFPMVTIIHRPHLFGRNFRVINFYSTRNKLVGVWRYLPLRAALICTSLELLARFCHALRSPARMVGFLQGLLAFAIKLPRILFRERTPIDAHAFCRWAYARHYVIRSLDEFERLSRRYSCGKFAVLEVKLGLLRRLGWSRPNPFLPASMTNAEDAEEAG